MSILSLAFSANDFLESPYFAVGTAAIGCVVTLVADRWLCRVAQNGNLDGVRNDNKIKVLAITSGLGVATIAAVVVANWMALKVSSSPLVFKKFAPLLITYSVTRTRVYTSNLYSLHSIANQYKG